MLLADDEKMATKSTRSWRRPATTCASSLRKLALLFAKIIAAFIGGLAKVNTWPTTPSRQISLAQAFLRADYLTLAS